MRSIKFMPATVFLLAVSGGANSQNFESMRLATELGDLLAAEEFCDLTYNQDAIADFIDNKVKADDMGFASTLRLMTDGAGFQLSEMSASQKTAHCRQSERVAKSYGFLK